MNSCMFAFSFACSFVYVCTVYEITFVVASFSLASLPIQVYDFSGDRYNTRENKVIVSYEVWECIFNDFFLCSWGI